ncbi:hypothetical protein [Pseudoduganella armeniaca]|uniref:hypothetical protein n=1 Tax=Pseudoduganella armeniaca TaxID=2072590 RepID=UPI001E434713|nr:hypothetical protein [Pseudoduganella armeniaca]
MYFAPHGDKAPASAPAASSQAPAQRLSRDQAMERLLALPELKAWSAAIEKNSGGSHHGAVIEYDPAPASSMASRTTSSTSSRTRRRRR